jgi:hypothetical protein
MPVEVALWRLGDKPERVDLSPIDVESRLEQILVDDPTIIDPNLVHVGRQVPTAYGKFIDLLALDSDGNLVVIELKRNRTPREVIAQLLDYGSWVRGLEDTDVASIFEEFLKKYYPNHSGNALTQDAQRVGSRRRPLAGGYSGSEFWKKLPTRVAGRRPFG